MNLLEERLENFPKRTCDTFERLQAIVDEKMQTTMIKSYEQARLEGELSVIKETNTASVFLFFYDTVYALKDVGAILHGVCHCSYLLYFLGLTKVNPFDYRLPFERYFHNKRKFLPFTYIAVQKCAKGKAIKYLKEQYGADKIARMKDNENDYILSPKSFLDIGEIEQTVLHADSNESVVWHEDISSLTSRDISRLNLYTLTIEETDMGKYYRVSEEKLYQKTLDFFTKEFRNFGEIKRYKGVVAAEKIFSSTEGKFVYQEQFFEICTKLLGVSNQQADEFRKGLCARKKQDREDIRALFSWKLGEEGVALFNYLDGALPLAVCKAYAVGLTFLKI